ncbi:ribbon-helix-helix protein, CopG family [Micrococcus flavus]|uniref:ribbon-helix-helix protein, CopG family n=1 Tax=Micrococcus flavus TaxID=384602 RepID=UPI001EF48775|nr:ribbon-helix-helix domain-containing protein [Micrococcus flavus]
MPTRRQPPHPSGQVVSVRLPPETIERLDALADRTGRSRGLYLRLALTAMLPQLESAHWHQAAATYEDNALERAFQQITAQLLDHPDHP